MQWKSGLICTTEYLSLYRLSLPWSKSKHAWEYSLKKCNLKLKCSRPTIHFLHVLLFQAEELILKGFPKKIVELNKLLETPQFCKRDLAEVHQSLNIPIPEPIALGKYVPLVYWLQQRLNVSYQLHGCATSQLRLLAEHSFRVSHWF